MTTQIELKNAIITHADIVLVNDLGILSADIIFDYGYGGQGFGSYNFGSMEKENIPKSNYCGHFITRMLQVTEAKSVSDMKGKPVRVKGDWNSVHEVGHFLKDDWFNPKEEFKIYNPKEELKE